MAKKSSTKNKTPLKGTNAADVLTVKHTQVTVNAGKGNDKINVNSGSSHKIYGEAGNDTIIVAAKAGSGSKFYGDDAKGKVTGNDTFNINGGKKNYFYGGKGVDTFNVNAGTTNYIYGGAGNDVIAIGKTSTGTAVVKDFSVKSGNKDSVKVTGGAVKSIAASGKNMIVKGGKSASVTLEGAKTKTFTVTDTLGSYTVSGANVKLALGKNVKGTVTAASFITTVDGRSDANAITINGNAKNNTIYGGAGNNILNGGTGNDTLSGGAGKDTFVYANGQGKDTISDYVAGQDTLQISSGSISKAALANSNKDLVFTVGSGSITLKNAAAKAISLKDSRGNYTASNTAITLGSDFSGTMDATKYLSSVKTIDGRNATKAVNITGNAQNNTIYAGKAGGTINGGAGNDTLYGGAGKDTLTGGAGNDTFVYANGQGTDTITDYAAGQDTLQISSGSISKAALANSNKDVVFTVGTGSITLQNAATKTISLKDSNGSYTASDAGITLGSDFTGTMDATKYLSSVTTIDGRNVTETINITGNDQDNTIYAGKAGGTINGGAGNDTLYGGVGKDNFVYAGGKETIYNYVSGSDIIKLSSTTLISTSVSGEDTILNLADGGSITVKNAANAEVLVVDSAGKSLTINIANAAGGSTVYGSDGADTFVYNASEGNATIKDYTEGEDTLQITDSEITKTEIINGNVVLTVGDEGNTITLEGAAGKSIEIHNSNGGLTLSENEISLGSDYTGDIDANAYLPMVTTIDGRNAEGIVNITGNSLDNTIYAGKEGGTINGGEGADILYSGAGNDTLSGGVGNDTFVYTNGGGDDTITDYEEGQDVIRILDGTVGRVEFDYTYKQVVLTIGDSSINGSITIKGADNKTISVQDSRGSFSFNDKEVKLGSDFGGLISSGGFIASRGASTWRNIIGSIDGREAVKYVSINVGENGAQVCTLYAGKAGSNLTGDGSIANTYYGGAGYDIFNYSRGTTTIYNYDYDKDYIQVDPLRFKVSSYGLNENGDFRLSISAKDTGYGYGSIIVKDVTKGVRYHGLTDGLSEVDMFNIDFIAGTEDADPYIEGTVGDDILLGFKGNDIIYGRAGNDTLHGGDDDDYLYGEAGKDILYGGNGKDYLYGGVGDDNLYGGDGNDILFGDAGSDTLNGGVGDDEIRGGTGNDTLYGDEGKDVFIYANGDGNDTVKDYTEGGDALRVTGSAISSAEIAYGNMVFTVGSGSVTLEGASEKTVQLQDTRGSYSVSADEIKLGADFSGALDSSAFMPTAVTLDGRNVESSANITGNNQNNIIYAAQAGGTLNGGAGKDTLYGGAGDDTLIGGIGADTFVYSSGNDVIKDYTNGEDVIRISDNSITRAELNGDSMKFVVGEGSITVEGTANKDITINDINGNYTVLGTTTDDTFSVDLDYTGTIDASFTTVTTITARFAHGVNLIGNAQNNAIFASVTGSTCHGGDGEDEIYGYNGNDNLHGDDGNDTLYGDLGDDTLHGGDGNDHLYGGDGDDHLYGGDGDDTLDGGPDNNILTGGSGNDSFVCGLGVDEARFPGCNVITDYTEEDTLLIFDNSITETIIQGENIKFIIGEDSATVQGGANKAIKFQDSNGTYTVSNQNIVMGSGYAGTIDVNGFLNTVTTIEFENVNSTDVKFDLEDYSGDYNNSKLCVDTGSGIVKIAHWSNRIESVKFADGIIYDVHKMGNENSQVIISTYNVATITNLNNNLVFGGTGKNTMSAEVNSNGLCNNNRLYGLSGNDEIAANHATNCYFSGGTGNDQIRILDGYGNIAEGGPGQDTYELWISNKNSRFSVTIDNTTAGSVKDLLVISDKTDGHYVTDSFWDDFNFAKNDGDLYITGRTFDAEIIIKDWDNHPLSKITFEGHNKTEEVVIEGNSIDNLVSMYPVVQNISSAMASFSLSSVGLTMSSSDTLGMNSSESNNLFITGNI